MILPTADRSQGMETEPRIRPPECRKSWAECVGNAYFAMEKYDLAEETYKKILDKEPANVEVTLAIGNCYANRGQSDKAIEWYNKIQFDNIKDATVLYNNR